MVNAIISTESMIPNLRVSRIKTFAEQRSSSNDTLPFPSPGFYSTPTTLPSSNSYKEKTSNVYDQITPRQLAGIKLELNEHIRQLWKVPNPYSDQFAVGTLCDTHEILFTVDKTYPYRGPFRTTEDRSGRQRNIVRTSLRFSAVPLSSLRILDLSLTIWTGTNRI